MNVILVSSTKRGIYKFSLMLTQILATFTFLLTREEADALGSADLFNPCVRITIQKVETKS